MRERRRRESGKEGGERVGKREESIENNILGLSKLLTSQQTLNSQV